MINFRCYSKYSLRHSIATIAKIAEKAKVDGDKSVAILDRHDIHSTIYLAEECADQGLKPIIGYELDNLEGQASHTLWALNNDGLINLNKISMQLSDKNIMFQQLKGIDFSNLVLIVWNGEPDSDIWPRFKKENKYIGISLNKPYENVQQGPIIELTKKLNVKIIAGSDVLYNEQKDALGHDYYHNYMFGDDEHLESDDYAIKNKAEFASMPFPAGAIKNAEDLAARIDLNIELGKLRLPDFEPLPNDSDDNKYTVERYLYNECLDGLKEKGLSDNEKYLDRLNHEMEAIHNAGLESYFLIVKDMCDYARKVGIWKGKGRGSAAGSLVCMALGITDIDPLEYDLIFERFYNAGRKGSLPDIDTDFEAERRGEIIEYLKERWGHDRVFQIITYGGLGPKKAVKAALNLGGCSFDEQNEVTDMIWHKAETIDEAINHSKKLKEEAERRKILFNIAKQYEGSYESFGKHAAGVIIAKEPYTHGMIPMTYHADDADYISGYDLEAVDAFGLLKIDVLGINTLDIEKRAEQLIRDRHDKDFSISKIPLNDKDVYEKIFHAGKTKGVFQLESQVGQKYSELVKPNSISEIADLITIIRPGAFDCIAGDVKILSWIEHDGTRRSFKYKTVKELFNDYQKILQHKIKPKSCGLPHLSILSVDDNGLFVKNKINQVVFTGIKPVFEIKLQVDINSRRKQNNCFTIKASEGHRFLTLQGWKKLKELSNNDYVALLRKRFGKSKVTDEGNRNFREIAFQNYQYKCIYCDWNNGSLDVNHLDGNREINNNPDNLCFMCPNHHRMYTEGTISLDDARTAAAKYRLPNTKDIMYMRINSINLLGEEETYDIEMCQPYHNYVAGGFVVHNSQQTDKYLETKNGKVPEYPHPSLEAVLGNTYSSCIYQEQILGLCSVMAGMDLQQADKVRHACGKKKKKEMDAMGKAFIDGCLKEGHDKKLADLLWSWIVKFSGYGFNKAHAISYAFLSYETAYLKYHYPVEFYEASCNFVRGDLHRSEFDKLKELINDAKLFGINITNPSIRMGNKDFAIKDDNTVVYGLTMIKGVGDKSAEQVITCKDATNFADFIARAFKLGIKKNVIEGLICSGALDCFKVTRNNMLADFELLHELTEQELQDVLKEMHVCSISEIINDISDESKVEARKKAKRKVPNIRRRGKLRTILVEYDEKDKFETIYHLAMHERKYLGTSLSVNEADGLNMDISHSCLEIKDLPKKSKVRTVLHIDGIKEIVTKKGKNPGQEMCFLTGGDGTYMLDNVVIFPRQYQVFKSLLKPGRVIHIVGYIGDTGGLIVNSIGVLK